MHIDIGKTPVSRISIFFHMLFNRSCTWKLYHWIIIWLHMNILIVGVNISMSARNRHVQTNHWCISIESFCSHHSVAFRAALDHQSKFVQYCYNINLSASDHIGKTAMQIFSCCVLFQLHLSLQSEKVHAFATVKLGHGNARFCI